ncbi:hypothetical protein [Streptomyces sp. NPDC002851]
MDAMLDPSRIPHYTGNLQALELQIAELRRAATGIRDHGGDVDTRFKGIGAFYKAPEAGQLILTTQSVSDKSFSFASDLESVAEALSGFAAEVRPLVERLEILRQRAVAFVAAVKADEGTEFLTGWTKDREKVEEHQEIFNGVNAAVDAFHRAEIEAANKITSLVGGTQWVLNDGSGRQKNAYGASEETLNEADQLPWGKPAHQTALPFGFDAQIGEFLTGLWEDNIVGSVEGLINLFSPGEEGDQTRKGLVMSIMGGIDRLLDPHNDGHTQGVLPEEIRQESRDYAKEFGKSLVAWDQWETNPARASSTVFFNVLTLGAGPLGAVAKGGTAGKAGAGARAAGAAAKVGEVLDPLGAAAKTAGAAVRSLPKISEVTAGTRNTLDAIAESPRISESVLEVNGEYAVLRDGELIPLNPDRTLNTNPAPREPSAAELADRAETPSARELVGAGARRHEASANVGDSPSHNGDHQAPPAGNASQHSSGSGPGHAPSGHGDTGTSAEPVPTGRGTGGHSGSGGAGGGAAGASGRDDIAPSGNDPDEVARRVGMSDEEVLREQVHWANTDPDWRKEHYYSNGRRHSVEGTDQFGRDLPQLKATGDPARPWTAEKGLVRATYHPGAEIGNPATVAPQYIDGLHADAAHRRQMIDYDMAAERNKQAAAEDYKNNPTPENELIREEAINEYKSTHTAARDASEDLGENAAELHAIPDHYGNATRLDDAARGRFRFDQIWVTKDGRYVVVEAKGSLTTELGKRNLGKAKDYQQGTIEYFEATLLKMKGRGEIDLADQLEKALANGNLDYVEVKANPAGDKYNGYKLRHFDIGRGRQS